MTPVEAISDTSCPRRKKQNRRELAAAQNSKEKC